MEVIVILVTGATGHLGNVLTRELLSRGERVRALVLPGEDAASIRGLDVERVTGNVLDPATLDRALVGVEMVYHLAGIISILPGDEQRMRRVNVEGVRNVAHAALKAGVRRLVHTSSIHAFQRVPHGVTVDETIPFAPASPAGAYDRTKAEGTLAVLQAVEQGLDGVIACPTGVIGPYDYLSSEMGQTILDFTRKKLHLLVDGAYDFVDVRDVARGLTLAGEKGRRGEAYILAGAHIKLVQIRKIVQELVGIRFPALIVPFGLAGFVARCMERFYRLTKSTPRFTSYALRTLRDNSRFSCAKAQRQLGYRPRPLRKSLADTIAWWQAHNPGMVPAN
jgi:dihydroflavonol-4-reductase